MLALSFENGPSPQTGSTLRFRLREILTGVARESINSKDVFTGLILWLLRLRDRNNYSARHTDVFPLFIQSKPLLIGLFVDNEGGEASFYDVLSCSLLYSFTRCHFAEKLYPI